MNRILLSIGIVFSFLLASGQDTILFTGKKQLVFNQSTYYIDSSKTATAQQVREAILAGKGFKGVLDLDYTHFPVWVCTKIINQSNQDRLVLIIENPLIDSSALFLKADAVLPVQKNYLGEGYNQRSSSGTYHKFTIRIFLEFTCFYGIFTISIIKFEIAYF